MTEPTIEQRIEDRVDQLVTNPAVCAFLLIVEERRLAPHALVDPETAFLVTGGAIEAISP